jgi:putative ABC transport system permease protein
MAVLNKKLLRDVREAWGQAAAVALVVLCGTATYIAIGSAYRNLLLTRDTYYQQYRFADFEISVERAPQSAVFKVETIPGVRQVRGRIVEDVNVDIEGQDETRTGRIVSMPKEEQDVLNDIVLMQGRYFSGLQLNEVILSEKFAEANNVSPGDTISATIDDRKHTMQVVGLALSPEFVYMIRNVQELVPSPERFGVLWVPEDFAETALNMKEASNNIIGTVDDPEDLPRILEDAEDILDAYGVYATVEREDQISNRFLSDEIKGLGVSARITPTVFLGIAALILLVLLSRMVRQERTQIGLLKAYGYSDWQVGAHYVKYALLLGLVGCLGGFVAGQWLANSMIQLYVQFYNFPILRSRVYPEVLARSMGIALFFSVLGAILAARQAARVQPAESMRPAAPTYGTRTLIERIGPLWRRLSFTSKMIVRNMARNPLRSAFNAFGVMVSTGVMLMGYFSGDAMDYIIEFQFSEVQREDVTISFVREFGKGAYYDVKRFEHVRHAEPILQYPFTVRNGWRKKDLVITGLPANARLQQLRDTEGNPISLGGTGLVLSEYLAGELGVAVGDKVEIEPLMGRIDKKEYVKVGQVVQQYLGSSAYMNLDALGRLLDEPFAMNAVLIQVDGDMAHELNKALKDVASVASVAIKQDLLQSLVDTLAASMKIMSAMMIFFAGTIAFAIIYNVTMVSLAERERELASLRVLGFTSKEVGAVLYRENFALAAIGIVMGIPFGMGICLLMVTAYTTDLYRFPFYISTESYLTSILFAVGFVMLANLAVRWRIKGLDMVEVLKSRE